MKLNEWLETWLEKYQKHIIKYKTYFNYRNLIRVHINPLLGDYELNQLNASILQDFINTKIEKGNTINGKPLSPNTLRSITSVLKNALRSALQFELISKNCFSFLAIPSNNQKEIEAFSINEQKKIEECCLNSNKANHFGIVLCLYTGLRIGELLALTWDDVDFKDKLLYVRHTLTRIKQDNEVKTILDEPKTKKSKRVIPLPVSIIKYLKEIKKNSASTFVISTRNNSFVSIRNYQRTYEKILKKCHVPYKNFHALRHTFATRAIEIGMDVKTLSEILGHTNATVTLNRYAHSMLQYKVQMMDKIGKLLV